MRHVRSSHLRDLSERPRALIAVAALLVLTIIVLGACGGDGGKPVTIAIDERTVLEVPAGALPDDVSVDDLQVRPGGVTLFETVEGGPEPLASYRLEPTGLTFAQPVTLRVTVPLKAVPAGVVTFLATEDQEAPELVPTRLEDRDEEAGTVTLVTELSHFSDTISYPATNFFLDVTTPQQATVDESFEVQIIVRGNPDVQLRSRYLNPEYAGTSSIQVATERPWFIKRIFSAFGPVSPTRVTDRPPRTSVTGNQFTVRQTFNCNRVGTARITYVALIDHQMWLIAYYESTDSTARSLPSREWKATPVAFTNVECIAPVVETATGGDTGTSEAVTTGEDTGTGEAVTTGGDAVTEPTVTVEMLIYNGQRFPLEQFRVAQPDSCRSPHYHADFEVFSLEGGSATDPNPPECGFGSVDELPVETVEVSQQLWDGYRNRLAGGQEGLGQGPPAEPEPLGLVTGTFDLEILSVDDPPGHRPFTGDPPDQINLAVDEFLSGSVTVNQEFDSSGRLVRSTTTSFFPHGDETVTRLTTQFDDRGNATAVEERRTDVTGLEFTTSIQTEYQYESAGNVVSSVERGSAEFTDGSQLSGAAYEFTRSEITYEGENVISFNEAGTGAAGVAYSLTRTTIDYEYNSRGQVMSSREIRSVAGPAGDEDQRTVRITERTNIEYDSRGNVIAYREEIRPAAAVEARGDLPFVPLQGTILGREFNLSGVGEVAGFSDVSVTLRGRVTADGEFTAVLNLGAGGELPTGTPIKFVVRGVMR